MLNTRIFSLKPGVYSSIILRRLLARYFWIAAVPAAIFLILGYYCDSSWYYLAPITVFLLAPLLLFFAYFLGVVNREAADALLPHRFVTDSEGIRCDIYRVLSATDHTDDAAEAARQKSGKVRVYDTFEVEQLPLRCVVIPETDIQDTVVEGEYTLVFLKGSAGRCLVIPNECQQVGNHES